MISDIIIMAGGIGERLWPASSVDMPKQFMCVDGNISFFQQSLQRALELNIQGKIIIVTRKDIELQCCKQCYELAKIESPSNRKKILKDCIVLSEPTGRHTSAAVMSGVILLKKISDIENNVILVMSSDHIINPTDKFISDCKNAAHAAEEGMFVCFAIPPTAPSTEYGYIKMGKDSNEENFFCLIDDFKEKPNKEIAKKYFESGDYWWNCGIFCFNSNIFFSEMENCTPSITKAFLPMISGSNPIMSKIENVSIIENWDSLYKVYETVPKIAIDKAIVEKTTKAVAVKANFYWKDVGNWDSFSEICKHPKNNSVVEIESNNNFIYSDLPITLCGVNNLSIIVKNGNILILQKGKSSLVKDIIK